MVSTCARGTYRDLYAQDYNEQTPDFSRCSRPLTHSMPAIAFTPEMALVLAILGATVALFVFDLLRTDIAALCILLSIGLSSRLPGLEPLVPPEALFSGFSSNAVIAIIAVMIIGAGLDRTGVMRRVSEQILRYGGQSEARLMVLISAATALLSCFVQNVAAAALFLPVVSRICQRTGIPVSRMMMPMGFAAILGGLGTTIGSSSLIVLNDLLVASSVRLPDGSTLQPLSLFSVFPLGFALTALGILWFLLIGWLGRSNREDTTAQPERRVSEYVERVYGIKGELVEARIGRDSPLAGRRVRALEQDIIDAPFLLALYSGDVVKVPPDPEETLWVDSHLGLMGEPEAIARFCEAQDLDILEEPDRLAKVLDPQQSGIAEVVITPSSNLVGNAIGDIKPRRNFGMNILQIARRGEVKLRGFGDIVLQAGDTLLVHASWADLEKLRRTNSNMVVATDFRYEPMRVEQQRLALLVSAASLLLFFLTDNLPLSLMAGAISMILTNVVSMDEAYEAVSWSTIFLLASLIPLGLAVDRTGTAAWLSQVMLNAVGDVPSWVLQSLLAVLATVFSLLMSNVGATILLVPLAINVAIATGADPALFALTIGVATSNAFLIPTNQVNALIAGPGGYRVSDFLRVGGGMTVIFLVASLVLLNLLFS